MSFAVLRCYNIVSSIVVTRRGSASSEGQGKPSSARSRVRHWFSVAAPPCLLRAGVALKLSVHNGLRSSGRSIAAPLYALLVTACCRLSSHARRAQTPASSLAFAQACSRLPLQRKELSCRCRLLEEVRTLTHTLTPIERRCITILEAAQPPSHALLCFNVISSKLLSSTRGAERFGKYA